MITSARSRRLTRRSWSAAAFATLTLASSAGAEPRAATIVAGGAIEAFAQDGNRIVWVDTSQPRCRDVVRLRDLATGVTQSLTARGAKEFCGNLWRLGGVQHRMALAGTRALWAQVTVSNLAYNFQLFTSAAGQETDSLGWLTVPGGLADEGPFVPVALAGDGQTLVYIDHSSGEQRGHRYVVRVPGGRVSGSYSTQAIAAADNRWAAARAVHGGCVCNSLLALSPDGQRLVYRSGRGPGGLDLGPGSWRLYVSDLAGHERPVPSTGEDDSWAQAAWAPDSRRLLVSSGDGSLAIVDSETGARSPIAQHAFSAVWSSDGRYVLFGRASGRKGVVAIVVALADGSHPTVSAGYSASWSPDQRHLAVLRKDGVYVGSFDGSGARRVVKLAADEFWAVDYRWTGDSAALVVASRGRLDAVPADGGDVWEIARGDPQQRFGFIVSPTSGDVAYQTPGQTPHLQLADVHARMTTDLGAAQIDGPFSPDSRRLTFVRDDHRWLVDVRAGTAADLGVSSGQNGQYAWAPNSGRLAWIGTKASDPNASELRVTDLRTGMTMHIGAEISGDLLWSPDSTRLSVGPIVVDPADGTSVTLPAASVIQWSPDSQSLIVSLPSATLNPSDWPGDLALVGRDGGAPQQITHTTPAPPWTGIEIRRTADSRILHSFPTHNIADSLALSRNRVALLRAGSVVLYTQSGVVVRTFAIDRRATEISMAGRWIVFSAGQTIEAIDTSNGRVRTLAHAGGRIVGLSIEGHRVAWAEQHDGPDVIRAIILS